MEHLSLCQLSTLFEFLTARDIAQLSQSCRALQPSEAAVQTAIGLVIKHRFGDVLGFLREDDPNWPRSLLVLRCGEVLRVKQVLSTAVFAPDAAPAVAPRTAVLLSKAWTLAWKKRCQLYKQYVAQFRVTKKKQRRAATTSRSAVVSDAAFADSEAAATRDASALIVCPHDRLLPLPFCVARAKRAVVSRSGFRVLATFTSDVRGFPVVSTPDCLTCVQDKDAADREQEQRRQERFEEQIAGSTELVDLLLRKNGYPNELFSPATTRGNTLLSLSHNDHHTYFLVPKKWLVQWRQFVRSLSDDAPGPILNSELVCDAHQSTIVPPYITMFLSGFSLEVSLQATQALGTCSSQQYEIVTSGEWEALADRYCAEYAVGFDVLSGSYHWRTPECNVCHFGMRESGQRRPRRRNYGSQGVRR
ncbi:hypothetical protein ATCC90586_006592 [Pythium insidiosum]|nr:hypothetical protein ATCC90586_006592 [Pythium insidiosum]